MTLDDRIIEVIANELTMMPTDVEPEQPLEPDDELPTVLAAIEAEFGIEVEPEEEADIETVGHVIEIVRRKIGNPDGR